MSRLKISILGLYQYDNTIFDNLVLPDEIDKDDLINNILINFSDMSVLYPNPDVIKEVIGYWSRTRLKTWQDMAKVLYEDYDPFINIKRDEVRTIEQVRDLANTGNVSVDVNAWNDTNSNRDNTSSSGTDTGTITTTEHFHVEGDSAITDAQDVLEKEMKIRIKYNLTDVIINEFKNKFIIMIY